MVQISTRGGTPNRGMGPREALFVKLLWPLVLLPYRIYGEIKLCNVSK